MPGTRKKSARILFSLTGEPLPSIPLCCPASKQPINRRSCGGIEAANRSFPSPNLKSLAVKKFSPKCIRCTTDVALRAIPAINKCAGAASEKLLAGLSVAAIIVSVIWIYFTQFATRIHNPALHAAVGEVMADETVHLLPSNAAICVVTIPASDAPEIKVQMEAFEKQLKSTSAITIKDKIVLDPRDNPKFRPGAGLSGKRLLKIARKHPDVDAIVSFVGAPELTDDEISQLKSFPKFFAEARSPEKLKRMFDKNIVQLAVVPRFEFPAPGPQKPETSRQWFDRYFQVIETNASLPVKDTSP